MSGFTNPSEPLRLTLIDGKEREFLLSFGDIRRLKAQFKVDNLSQLLNRDIADIGPPILYRALRDKGDLTEDQLADLLPAHLEEAQQAVLRLLGASFPESKPTDPPPASPVAV